MKKKMPQKEVGKGFKAVIIASIIFFLIGLIVGFEFGVSMTIKKVVEIASRFINIDEQLVSDAIFQYQNNIGNCFPKLNVTG